MGIIESMRLDGKAIYVTGAASGIGKAAATAFAEAGADVAIVDINLEGAEKVAKEIAEATGSKTIAIQCDVTKKDQVEAMVAILITLVVSTLIGTLNGFMVSTVGIPALIATFATQTAFQGLAYLVSGGLPVNGFTESFKIFGQGYIGIVPVPVIIMVICFALGSFILNKTYFGRYFYAVGGNVEAARLSGIRVGRIKYLVFSISGFFAGLAGIVMLSRTNSGMPNAGLGYEFDVITCVVLGGVSVAGGYGKISGVVAGTFIIGALQNGMVLMNINSFIQDIVMGVVLALAVGFDCIQKRRQTT